ncbi:MAG: hypothetical protein ABI337_01005 [Nitrososphaera sp.]
MNCKRCHHAPYAHTPSKESSSLVKLGRCSIPHCTCKQYVEFEQLDEELL